MLSFLASITILLPITRSQSLDSCDYGYFGRDYDSTSPTYNECVYKCNVFDSNGNSQTTPILLSTLTFDEIASHSADVSTAIEQYGSCSILNDLIWDATSCIPYCKCDVSSTNVINRKTYFKQTCTECRCSTQDYTNSINGWSCSEQFLVNTASQWNDYTCTWPITECTDPYDQSTSHSPGRGWFVDSSYDSSCQTYCYCNFDGTVDCENSYANILSSSNIDLTNGFKNYCWDADGCMSMDGVSLMVSDDSTYCDCPTCACPTGSNTVGDTFYREYTEPRGSFDGTGASHDTSCLECTCQDNGGNLRQSCDWGDGYSYEQGTESCPQAPQQSCKVGSGSSTSRSEANMGMGVQSQQCYGEHNQNCGWSYYPNDSNDGSYGWQCQDSMFCKAFAGDNSCVHLNVELNTFNVNCEVDSNSASVSVDRLSQYTMCCTGNDCNDQDIDISQCVSNPETNQWYSNYFECKYGALYREFFCSEVDTYSCDDIKRLGTWYFGCDCSAFGDMYNWDTTDATFRSFLESEIQGRFSGLDDWNTLFGCGTVAYTCDLSTGVVSINGQAQNQVTSMPTQSPVTSQPTTGTPTQQTGGPTLKPSESPTTPTIPPTTGVPTESTTNPSGAPTQNICDVITIAEPFFQELESDLCDFCYEDEFHQEVCSRMIDIIDGTVTWQKYIQDCFLAYCNELNCAFDQVGIKSGVQTKKDCSCDIFDCNGGVNNQGSGANQLKVFVGIGVGLITVVRLCM